MSRIANRAFFLTEDERTRFVERMWSVAKFSGVKILSYCFMSDHFHLLIYLPDRPKLSDDELLSRISDFFIGEVRTRILKDWAQVVQSGKESLKKSFRSRFLYRMYNVSEFMKTLKQCSTMSYNYRRVHAGTMWESRFFAREYMPEEKVALMKVAGYIDRNPVKARMVAWPDKYEWCGFAAACRGDRRCISGYSFIYEFGPTSWDRIREQHEMFIRQTLKELEDEKLNGPAKKGLSVDEKKMEKIHRRAIMRFEESLPDIVPHLLEKGSDKVAFDLLKLLIDGPKQPSELRNALGIASANFFTARYLTPLTKDGYVAIEGGVKNRFSPMKKYKLLQRGRALVNA